MAAEIWSNYNAEVIIDLTFTDVDGNVQPHVIPTGQPVEGVLKNLQGDQVAPKKTSNEAHPKANWPQGRMVLEWTAAELANLQPGQGLCEASVNLLPVEERVTFKKGVTPGAT